MTRRVARLLALFALLAVLASSCFGGGEPEPLAEDATPSPRTASPTATATPAAVTASPTATPIGALTPTAAPTPEPPAVTVQGPLLVLSERVGDAPPREGSEVETRRVLIYDLADDRYWAAFEYRNPRTRIGRGGHMERSAVQPAGTDLVVWSGDQVRRMSLDGEAQMILFEHDAIRAIKVSPDGSKVAVMHGEPGTLAVLDLRSGDRLLRVSSDHADLAPLRYGPGGVWRLELGIWRDDGRALTITARGTAVVSLDSGISVLPEGSVVSPNLRYAIQFGESIAWSGPKNHQPAWDSLTVLDVETGRVVWTIKDEGGLQSSAEHGPWFGSYVTLDYYSTRLLDTATGETLPLTPDIERRVEGPVRSTCGITYSYPLRSSACYVQYDDQVVWEGASGWAHYLGMIEVSDGLEVRGIEPVAAAREVPSPPPPARDEMVGPLLAYEVHGEYEYHDSGGRPDPLATRRVIVRDEGTGRTWLAFTYRNRFAHGYRGHRAAQPALGGFVAEIDQRLTYFAPDGQPRTLHERWPDAFHVSPDGRKLAATFYGGHNGTAYVPSHIVVLDIPAGGRILLLTTDEIAAAAGLDVDPNWSVSLPVGEAWTSDSRRVVVRMLDWSDEYHEPAASHVLVTLGGAARSLPCDRPACLSPDARYMVRGSGNYFGASWSSFDIIDFETDRVLWTAETTHLLNYYHWEWATADQFAWSSDFIFLDQRLSPQARGRAAVSVLDVTTGDIEVMDSGDYLARFYPPPRASTDCPEHPAHPCRILLGGEVVGEGRWPRIIGFIELE